MYLLPLLYGQLLLLRRSLPHLSESIQFKLRETQDPRISAKRDVGFFFVLNQSNRTIQKDLIMATPSHNVTSRINIDLIAIAIGLTLAALIRFNILPAISF